MVYRLALLPLLFFGCMLHAEFNNSWEDVANNLELEGTKLSTQGRSLGQSGVVNAAEVQQYFQALHSFRHNVQVALQHTDALSAGMLVHSYFDAVLPAVDLHFLTKPQKEWNLKEISESVALEFSAAVSARAKVVSVFPSTVALLRKAEKNVVYSIRDTTILAIGLKQLLRKIDNSSYEIAVRCVTGAAYATKFSQTYMVSGAKSLAAMEGRLANLSPQPFCMGENLAGFIRKRVHEGLDGSVNLIAKMGFLTLLPDGHQIMPPILNELKNKKIGIGPYQYKLDEAIWSVVLAPELVQAPATQDQSTMTQIETNNLLAQLKTLDVSHLGGAEKILTAFDARLVADIQAAAQASNSALTIDDRELERRIRLGQVLNARSYADEAIGNMDLAEHMVASDATSDKLFAQKIELALKSMLMGALEATLTDVLSATIPNLQDLAREDALVKSKHAVLRHFERIKRTSHYNAWVNQAMDKIRSAANQEKALSLGHEGYAYNLQKAALQMEASIGAQVSDENLPYDPAMVISMLDGEIKNSSSRVQSWFAHLLQSGAYMDFMRTQTRTEAHIKSKLQSPEVCEPRPLGFWKRAWAVPKALAAALVTAIGLGNEAGRPRRPVNQDEIDCERFVRLSMYAQIRNQQEMPKTMAGVKQAITELWTEDNAKLMLSFYRDLLKIKHLDQFRILDLVLEDRQKTLSEVMSLTQDTSQLHQVIQTVLDNLTENMRELTAAKNLDELGPFIANSTLLDSAFDGMSAVLRPDTETMGQSPYLLDITELIKANKIDSYTNLRASGDSSHDHLLALNAFHAMMKAKYRLDAKAHRGIWDATYKSAMSAIMPVFGIAMARRMLVPVLVSARTKTPWYVLAKNLNEYIAVNQGLARGYLSLVSFAFAGDALYQHTVGLDAIDNFQQRLNRYAYSELMEDGLPTLKGIAMLSENMELEALREDAKTRRLWGAALSALPVALPVFIRGYGKLAEGFHFRRELRWRNLRTTNPERFKRELSSLKLGIYKRLRKLMAYHAPELRKLGLSSNGDPFQVLNLNTLQQALKKVESSGAPQEVLNGARNSYRKIVQSLYSDVGSYLSSGDYTQKIFSQLYAGSGKTEYIDQIAKEYRRVVLGL